MKQDDDVISIWLSCLLTVVKGCSKSFTIINYVMALIEHSELERGWIQPKLGSCDVSENVQTFYVSYCYRWELYNSGSF